MSDEQNKHDDSDMPADKYAQAYLKMQMQHQEMMREQEEKRIALEEEKGRQKREIEEKINEYNAKCRQVPVTQLKKWAGSWVVLVLSILSSVSVLCALVSVVTNLSNGAFKIIFSLVSLLLACLVCAGFWKSYVMGKSKELTFNAGGPRMLRGVLTFYKVMMYIVMVLIVVLAVVIFISLKSCADFVTDAANKLPSEEIGETANVANSAFTGILVGLLFVVIAVFAVLIVYFTFATRFANDVMLSLTTSSVVKSKTMAIAVLFFIVGGFSLIGAIGSVAAATALNGLLEGLGDIGNTISNVSSASKVDIASMLGQIANAGAYIFGGILAIQFGGLSQKVEEEKNSIEKPDCLLHN